MKRLKSKLRDLFQQLNFRNPSPKKPHWVPRTRLEVEVLEDRSLMSTTTIGNLTGVAFVDLNHTGVISAQEAVLPGIAVSLIGTDFRGVAVNQTVATDASGTYTFANVLAGTYQLTANSPSFFGGIGTSLTLSGEAASQNIAFAGLNPDAVSLDQFLTTSTNTTTIPLAAAGTGSVIAGPAPFLATAITPVSVATSAAPTVLDLAANFSDKDTSDSEVQLETSAGPIDLTLFDGEAPQTVANFFNYINSGLYNNTVFHRSTNLASDGLAVLQGGGFAFETSPSQLVPVTTFPSINNEPNFTNRSNVEFTIAMAKGSDANSATSQFFFNLSNNASSLDNTSNSGGFTVFGKIADAASQAVLLQLAELHTQDESTAAALPASEQGTAGTGGKIGTGVFNEIPLQNYTGTAFPTDTTAANYGLVTSVKILHQSEALKYSIVSNTNPNLVTPSLGTGDNNRLTLTYATGKTGTATITVKATDSFGATTTSSFTVTVS